jgi:hypothetical protein
MLGLIALESGAQAQVVKPEAPEKKPDEKPAAKAEDADEDEGESEDEPKTKSKSSIPAEVKSEQESLPPPPPPRNDEQFPRPYLERPSPIRGVRHVELGPDFGLWSRPAKDERASYATALAWGAHARVEILPVLGFSAHFNAAKHEVTVADPDVDQPPLEVLQIGARLEPTWPVLPTLRLWLGVGVAWGRATAPSPTVVGLQDSSIPDRSGVFLEWSGALGGTYDVIPNWLALSLSFSGGAMANQSGDLFDEGQAVNQNAQMVPFPGMPEIESSFAALLGVGMIL